MAKKQEKELPFVRVRNIGQVTSTLERYAALYRAEHPDRDVRYVYDPTHKPELSGILERVSDGYTLVTNGEIGTASTSDEEHIPVRVGDLVMMSIDKKTQKDLRKADADIAAEQRLSVSRAYRDAIESAASEGRKVGARDPITSVGQVSIDVKEKEYDIEQRSQE